MERAEALRDVLEAALQEASELIHDLIDSGDGEVARVQRLVRTALAQQDAAPTTSDDLSFATLRAANVRRCEESFHPLNHWNAMEWGAACAGEVGEGINAAKKLRRIQDSEQYKETLPTTDVTLQDVADEIADAVIYADLWAASIGVDLGEAIASKFNRTSEKVQSGIKLEDATPRAADDRVMDNRGRMWPTHGACMRCGGMGELHDNASETPTCPDCKGTGKADTPQPEPTDDELREAFVAGRTYEREIVLRGSDRKQKAMDESTDDERTEASIYDIADEHARSVRQMFADRDYVLPNMYLGLIAADMRLLAERVDNRRRKIESTRHVIDSAIKKHDARRQPVRGEADEESGGDHE